MIYRNNQGSGGEKKGSSHQPRLFQSNHKILQYCVAYNYTEVFLACFPQPSCLYNGGLRMIGTLSDIKSRFMEVKQQIRFIFVAIVVFPGNGGIGWIGDLAPMSNLRNEESYALEKDTMKSNPHCFLGVQGKGNLREVVRESLSSLYWDSCRVWEGDVMGFSLLYIKIRR